MNTTTKDGEVLTAEMQQKATLIYFETPKGNIIVLNDAVFDLQTLILSKEDFKRLTDMHAVGGNLLELAYSDKLINGEFKDEPMIFNFFPSFAKLETLCDEELVGTLVYCDKDISTPYVVVMSGINKLDMKYFLLNIRTLGMDEVTHDTDNFYRLEIKATNETGLTVAGVEVDHVDVLKMMSVNVGAVPSKQ